MLWEEKIPGVLEKYLVTKLVIALFFSHFSMTWLTFSQEIIDETKRNNLINIEQNKYLINNNTIY